MSSSYFKGNTFKSYEIPKSEVETFLNITDCVFKQNEVMTIINMGENSDTIIANTVFENNTFDKTAMYSMYESSCVSVKMGKISIKNMMFAGNRMSPLCNGGLVTCYGAMSVELENVTMLNNVGKTIQAIGCIMNVSYLTFVNNSITKCKACRPTVTKSNVTVSYSDFHDNNASFGGCFCVTNSKVTLSDSSFYNNSASHGGCICVSNQAHSIINVRKSKFFSNFALQEGGVFTTHPTGYISSFPDNRMAIPKQLHVLRFSECSFRNNHANTVGGAFTLGGADVLFSNCTIIQNTAGKSGGALFLESCQTVLNFVTVEDNQASVDGGGILVTFSGIAAEARIYSIPQLYNVDARGNVAGYKGGFLKIYRQSKFAGKNLKLENNFAEKTGSDIILDDYSVGTMDFVFFGDFSKKHTCSLAAEGQSNLILKNIYSNNKTKVPQSNVCLNGRSYISNFTTGKLSILHQKFHLFLISPY